MGRSQGAPIGRIRALDGLRGLASLVVVIHHALITYPALAGLYADRSPIADAGSLPWWLVNTPLHLLWAGGEAVFVFFVLSGLVLALLVRKQKRFSWAAYYPSRLLRLYLPVWASIVFAVLVFATVRAISPEAGVAWVADRGTDLNLASIMQASLFLRGTLAYNNPLWSLFWEVLFSLLLPIFGLVLMRSRIGWRMRMGIVFAMMAVGSVLRSDFPLIGHPLFFLSMFAVGVVIAADIDAFAALASRIEGRRRPRAAWSGLLLLGLLALCSYWFLQQASLPIQIMHLTYVIQVAGAALVIFCVAFNPRVGAPFEFPAMQWLGMVSFSLYLVHDPILLAANHLTGGTAQPIVLIVGVPASIAMAWVFHVLAERPSHRLAKHVSRGVEGWFGANRASSVTDAGFRSR